MSFGARGFAEGFGLSISSFGLVDAATSSLTAGSIEYASNEAALLEELFNVSSSGNDVLNATIFAITASDDGSVTAIWAHQQSVADDATIGAAELFLRAKVNTPDGQFGLDNQQSRASGWKTRCASGFRRMIPRNTGLLMGA